MTDNQKKDKIDVLSIFGYTNYRLYVRDHYENTKKRNKNFSYRVFARMAGFKSSNFIKFVIDGKSNVSEQSSEQLAKAMGLGKEETEFFKNLVNYNQAKTPTERYRFASSLVKFQKSKSTFPLREKAFNYTSKWYLSVLRGIVALVGFKEDAEWISNKLNPAVSPFEIKKGFSDLIDLGLLERDSDGKLKQTYANIATDDEVALSSVAQFHREMMARASESIDNVPREKRDISGITLAMSEETAAKLKEMVQNFRKEVVNLAASEDPKDTKVLYQLNMQVFPLFNTESTGEGSDV